MKSKDELRKKAIEILKDKFPSNLDIDNLDMDNLIQELRVYHIELELQNEELLNTQDKHYKLIEKYSSIFEFAPIGYFIFDTDSIIKEVNQTGAIMLNKDKSSLLGKKFHLFIHPESQDDFYFHVKKAEESFKLIKCELKVMVSSNDHIFVMAESIAIKDKNEILIRSAISDITHKKLSEQKSIEQRNLLRALIDSIPEPIFYKDMEGRYLGCNESFTALFTRIDKSDIKGRRDYEIFDDQALIDYFSKSDMEVFEKQIMISNEDWIIVKDNKNHLFETIKTPYKNEKGELIGLIGICRDITNRKRYEETLMKTRDYYKKLFQDFPNPVWTSGLDMKGTYFNDAWLKFTGRSHEEELGFGFTENIHPDDIIFFLDKYKQSFQNKISFKIIYRLKRYDGFYHYVENHGSPYHDINGNFKGFIGTCYDIHSRRMAEEELAKTSTFYSSTIDALSAHITVLDEDGTVLSYNRAWEEFIIDNNADIPLDMVNYFSAFPKIPGIDPYEAEIFLNGIRNVIEGRLKTYSREYKCHVNNSEIWFLGKVTKFYNREPNIIVVSHENITERKLAETGLRDSEVKFRTLFMGINTSVLLYDKDSNIVLINDEAKRIFQNKDIVFYDENNNLISPDDHPVRKVIKEEQPIRSFVVGIDSFMDDKRIWMHSNADPIFDSNNDLKYIILTLIDITDRKNLMEQLKKAKELSEKATKAKSDFLSSMSHEIRTPLNAIIGLTEILLQDNIENENYKNIKNIKFAADNLLSIISDILDFSKIEAGKISFEANEFELRSLLMNLSELFTLQLSAKKLPLHILIEDDLPDIIIGDKARLNQIILNLLSNAIKFTEEGSISVSVNFESEDKDSIYLKFIVQDTGIGIPEEKYSLIFKSFSQVHTDPTKSYGGTGLGLSITKKLVEMQGGSIGFESQLDKGSKFFFILPFKRSDKKKLFIAEKIQTIEGLGKIRTLLAEDNELNQYLAKQIFNKWEMELIIANNGREALDILRKEEIDIILMDLQMPVLNGYEASRIIRKEFPFPKCDIPIIALTADTTPQTRRFVYDHEMNDFLSKPFKQKELYSIIAKNLKLNTEIIENKNEISSKLDEEKFVMDLEYLKSILGDDNESLIEILAIFKDQIPEYLNKIEDAIKKRDRKQLEQSAHKMKSSFSSMGVQKIADHLGNIEKKAKNNEDFDEIIKIFKIIQNSSQFIIEDTEELINKMKG